jgi:hypothetical protein
MNMSVEISGSYGNFDFNFLWRNSKMAARAGAKNLHFTLNREPRRPPGPPVAGAHTAWEDADQVSFAVPR